MEFDTDENNYFIDKYVQFQKLFQEYECYYQMNEQYYEYLDELDHLMSKTCKCAMKDEYQLLVAKIKTYHKKLSYSTLFKYIISNLKDVENLYKYKQSRIIKETLDSHRKSLTTTPRVQESQLTVEIDANILESPLNLKKTDDRKISKFSDSSNQRDSITNSEVKENKNLIYDHNYKNYKYSRNKVNQYSNDNSPLKSDSKSRVLDFINTLDLETITNLNLDIYNKETQTDHVNLEYIYSEYNYILSEDRIENQLNDESNDVLSQNVNNVGSFKSFNDKSENSNIERKSEMSEAFNKFNGVYCSVNINYDYEFQSLIKNNKNKFEQYYIKKLSDSDSDYTTGCTDLALSHEKLHSNNQLKNIIQNKENIICQYESELQEISDSVETLITSFDTEKIDYNKKCEEYEYQIRLLKNLNLD